MTTIALKNGILATDTRLVSGGTIYGTCRKLHRSKDGWWAATYGDAAAGEAFSRWMATRCLGRLKYPYKGLPEGVWRNTGALLLAPNGETWFYEGHALVAFEAPFTAEGSGGDLARGRMDGGGTAIEAIQTAIRWDPNSGGEIHFVTPGAKEVTVWLDEANQQT